jgi:hypothetical protein
MVELTSYNETLGRPESAFLMGSNETNVVKGGARKVRKHKSRKSKKTHSKKSMKKHRGGGKYLEFTVDESIPVGPSGAPMSFNVVENNTTVNPLNLGASTQHSGMTGGNSEYNSSSMILGSGENANASYVGTAAYGYSEVQDPNTDVFRGSYAPVTSLSKMVGGVSFKCPDLRTVKSIKDIEYFWFIVNKPALVFFEKLDGNFKTNKSKKPLEFIKELTRSYCNAVNILSAKEKATVLSQYSKMKSSFKNAYRIVKSVDSKLIDHFLASNFELFNRIKSVVDEWKSNNVVKITKKRMCCPCPKNGGSRKKSKKAGCWSKKMKGGYNQYMSNVPLSASYSIASSGLPASESALANPLHIEANNVHGIDNYNHYEGAGSETGVFDQAPPMN